MSKTVDLRRLIGDLREADGNITFVIGAGASISAGIPSAAKLVEEICSKYGHRLDRLTESERANYGRVMGCLDPGQRQKLISPYLEDAKLNWGHLALASLIAEGKVKRVLTFNFDLLLEKALAVLGRHVAVYDFGMMPTKQVNRLVEPSIVHLHGQGYGMKLLNSEEETTAHCEHLRPLFDTALKGAMTVVFGYGGKADPVLEVMTAENDPTYPLYWLGHDETAGAHLAAILAGDDAVYLGGCDFDRVMIDLAEGLGVWPPPILDNPMRHVLAVLEPTTAFPLGDDTAENILTEARRRLGDFAEQWETRPLEQRVLESPLRAPRNAPSLDEIQVASLSPEARTVLAWHFVSQGLDLVKVARGMTGEAAVGKWREAAAEFARAWAIQPDMHEALNNWGAALADMSKHQAPAAAVATLREAGEKYAQALAVKPDKHEALYNWGNALADMSKHQAPEAAVATLREAGEKYAQALAVKPDFHEALNNWGNALREMSKHQAPEAAVATLREAGEKYAQALALKPDDHDALNNWGNVLREMSKHQAPEAAVATLREAGEKYAQALAVKPDKHEALNNWGNVLFEISKHQAPEAAVATLREAGEKYAEALAVKPDFHEALYNWGNALLVMSKHQAPEAALETPREAGEKYAQALAVKPDFHEALYNWGNALLETSKHQAPEAALLTLREAGEKYAQALALKPDEYEAHYNWASALLMIAARSTGEDRVRALDTAEEKLTRHRDLTGKTSFNHACLHALRGETDAAVAALVACLADGRLPEPAHLDADTDLDSIRDDPAYRVFRASLDAPKDAA